MFDKHSSYALNKVDKTAIVCPSVTKEHIRLTQEDFSSEEEFLLWKSWSDEDYHQTELAGRKDDACFSLEDQWDARIVSAEDAALALYTAAEQAAAWQRLLELFRSSLTVKQFRRMWRYFVEKIPVIQIAQEEGVTEPSVSESINRAKDKISKKLF